MSSGCPEPVHGSTSLTVDRELAKTVEGQIADSGLASANL